MNFLKIFELDSNVSKYLFQFLEKSDKLALRLTCEYLRSWVDNKVFYLIFPLIFEEENLSEMKQFFQETLKKYSHLHGIRFSTSLINPETSPQSKRVSILLEELVSKVPLSIQWFDFTNCLFVDANLISKFPRNISRLTLLNCKQLDDLALKNLPPHLKHLNLSGCIQVTPEGLVALSDEIEELRLVDSEKMNPEIKKICDLMLESTL